MFEPNEIAAFKKILGLDGDPPKTFSDLVEYLFPNLPTNVPRAKYPPAVRLRGKIQGKPALNKFSLFYKAERMNWPRPEGLSKQEVEFLEAVHSKHPTEQKLKQTLQNFFSAAVPNRRSPTKE
jgi:hypothetical protein